MIKNWKTTVGGIMAALGIVATQVSYALDGDPGTNMNIETIIAQLTAAAGILWMAISARDKNVSSKDMGIE